MAVANLHRRGETSRGYDQFAGCDCWRWEVCSCPEITDIESSLTVGTLHTIQSAMLERPIMVSITALSDFFLISLHFIHLPSHIAFY